MCFPDLGLGKGNLTPVLLCSLGPVCYDRTLPMTTDKEDFMEKRFKEGDSVQQKHGGPQMTVSGYNGRGEVICILSNGKKLPLPQAVLRLCTPSKV